MNAFVDDDRVPDVVATLTKLGIDIDRRHFPNVVSYFSSSNPTSTVLPASTMGRFTSIDVFAVGLDGTAEAPVRRIFGEGRYLILERLESLPELLPRLCARLER